MSHASEALAELLELPEEPNLVSKFFVDFDMFFSRKIRSTFIVLRWT